MAVALSRRNTSPGSQFATMDTLALTVALGEAKLTVAFGHTRKAVPSMPVALGREEEVELCSKTCQQSEEDTAPGDDV